jgi:hypothetical protein
MIRTKKKKGWKSQLSKTSLAFCLFWLSAIPTWISWVREVYLMQTQLFWIPDTKTYHHTKSQQKKSSYERDDFSKTTYKFCQQTYFCEEISLTYLNVNCLLWKWQFLYFLGEYKRIGGMWGLGFHIK